MTPRERASALVAALEPEVLRALVQAALQIDVPACAPASDGPPHPDGWTCAALAQRYGCSPSSMRERIAGGEFGEPDEPGGPTKRGRGWLVSHAAVLARDARVLAAPAVDIAPPPVATGKPSRGRGAPISILQAYRDLPEKAP